MDRLREMILRVARSQAPVHIYGESGTGKELVARMIHASGPRAEGPFVPVNCGAIPSELMESEFFGHKRGSFTGAVTDKVGLIPSAEGGTLFLDEVADLPLHMQVKLLRVIQEKTVRPIGEQREVAHRRAHSLRHAQEPRRPRRECEIPRGPVLSHQRHRIARAAASRARRGHSRAWPMRSCAGLSRRLGAEPPTITPEALDMLQNFAFPGNVRELENVLERALALCNDGRIERADLQRAPFARENAPAAFGRRDRCRCAALR